jgi:hypothetical protein
MDSGRHETDAERMDRNWSELLQELRVTQTGVQILAGFLLTLPFQQRFTQLSPAQRALFLAAVALATVATGLLIAPVSSHRLLFRHHEKDILVDVADASAKAGLTALAFSVVAVVGLIFSVVTGPRAGVIAAGLALVFFLGMWLALPAFLLRRADRDTRHARPGAGE